MKKEYIEYEEELDENYGRDSDEDIELLDDVEDIESAEKEDFNNSSEDEDLNINVDYFNGSLISYLTYELTLLEVYRKPIEFKYQENDSEYKEYTAVVIGKSQKYPNRYVFKILPGNNLKGFWIDKIVLI